jgi:tRNA-specific 2-thiouridylase
VLGIHFIHGYETNPVDLDRLQSQLNIPIETVDLSSVFEAGVVHYFIESYLKGCTPNPCMVCNKKIKFGALLSIAVEKGADYLATGHYAGIRIEKNADQVSSYLVKGKDPKKDQSYFLSFLSSDQLNRVIFPLDGLTKTDVKAIAAENQLTALSGKESQDICFISNQTVKDFIISNTRMTPRYGDIVDLNGNIIGSHSGLLQFTLGQRRGINCPASEPYYVKHIDMNNNRLVVCFKKDIMEKTLSCDPVFWNYSLVDQCRVNTKIRYNHRESAGWLSFNDTRVDLVFDSPQFAVTPGQGAVFYQNDRVLGAGIIQ